MKLTREERIELKNNQREEIKSLWDAGIPGLVLSKEEINKLRDEFHSWAIHFQLLLIQEGSKKLLHDYEKLIYSIENSTCEHDRKINKGKDWQNCCGIYYEYLNNISCRTAIEIIIKTISIDENNEFIANVEKLDQRFKAVPKMQKWIVSDNVIEKYQKNDYWWYFGLPLTVVE